MGKETKAGNQEARWETKMGNQGSAIKMGNQGGKPRPAFRVGEGLRIVEAALWSRECGGVCHATTAAPSQPPPRTLGRRFRVRRAWAGHPLPNLSLTLCPYLTQPLPSGDCGNYLT